MGTSRVTVCDQCGGAVVDPVVIRVSRLDWPQIHATCCSLGCAAELVLLQLRFGGAASGEEGGTMVNADLVVWEDPPPARLGRRSRGRWEAIFAQLRERPGVWALVAVMAKAPDRKHGAHERAAAQARNIRNGRVGGAAPGEFEAVARKERVYARYVGGCDA